ncbi:bifunctional DNA primase/polymerase [Deinococcus peraridilitoris]|uniref:Bifunctional DNA primase/polymerase famiily protein n=1 Tax=Deinococcus peraridilitoris (strain DSM 19664 / LMG 22246 / CIP 109416 / KR-200) TaxID=937777 RepID=L0A370_DEIPD|nr:bifunctional DNA primase/polymerase [Deinococcus peraridilitoris]AFZ67894.1 bifunctional DNA primase/polymerase famiily protein [Deinococcus peraridilitoris DSM 19664]
MTAVKTYPPVLEAALAALERGWSVLPVANEGEYAKKPHYCLTDTGHSKPGKEEGKLAPSWEALQRERPTPEYVRTWLSHIRGKGVAVITGQLSGVIVLDFDGQAGAALLKQLNLQPHVRTGSGGFHVYFPHPGWKVQTLNSKSKAELGQRYPGLDIRADGGYAVLPPSKNVSGPYEQLRNFSDLEPLESLPEELRAFLGLIAPPQEPQPPTARLGLAGRVQSSRGKRPDEATLLEGALKEAAASGRNNGGFWLACQLRDNGYSEVEARDVGRRYLDYTPEENTKGQNEAYTLDEFEASLRQAYSAPAREAWQRGHATRRRSSAQTQTDIAEQRPEIVVNGRFLREIAEDAVRALEGANDPPTLFRRGGAVVRLDQEEDARAVPLDAVALKGVLDRTADFVKLEERVEKGEDGSKSVVEEVKPARPPADLAPDLLARVDRLPLPSLRILATSPLFSEGGELVCEEGYHAESGIYLASRGLENVCDDVSTSSALALLRELLCDFPFTGEAGFAHTLAALLLPFVRPMIDGPTPLHLIEAPTRGTGKGLLSEVIAHVSLGHAAGVMVQPKDGDEFEKRVTSTLLEGARIILLDNVHTLKGEALAAALTARTWKGRRLGKSEMLTLPNDALWLATGNNVALDDDMPRRIVPIRLDPGVERPEERTGFRHENLLGWVKENRPALVSACLSLVSAWLWAGRPIGTGKLGSYEGWAATMGGILDVAGVLGFLTGREHLYETANAEPQEWAAVLAVLYEQHGAESIGAREFQAAMQRLDACSDYWEGKTRASALRRVGRAVTQRRDRVFGGFRVRAAGKTATGNAAYRVVPVGEGWNKTPETSETPGEGRETPVGTVFPEKATPPETPGVSAVFLQTPAQTPEKHRDVECCQNSTQGVSGVSGVLFVGQPEDGEDAVEL